MLSHNGLRLLLAAACAGILAASGLVGCAATESIRDQLRASRDDASQLSDEAIVLPLRMPIREPGTDSPFDCGIDALTAVAAWYRRPVPADLEEQLAVQSEAQHGLTGGQVRDAIGQLGLDTMLVQGSMTADEPTGIPYHLTRHRPCIAMIRLPVRSANHFVTIVGHDPVRDLIVIQDGESGRYAVTTANFSAWWEACDRFLLVVAPQSTESQPADTDPPATTDARN